ARYWDAGSGKPLGPTLWHADGVRAVAFDASGQRAATGGRDQVMHQWHVPPPPMEGSAERIRLWVEVLTGMELDPQGAVRELRSHERGERRRRVEWLGGRPRIPAAVFGPPTSGPDEAKRSAAEAAAAVIEDHVAG